MSEEQLRQLLERADAVGKFGSEAVQAAAHAVWWQAALGGAGLLAALLGFVLLLRFIYRSIAVAVEKDEFDYPFLIIFGLGLPAIAGIVLFGASGATWFLHYAPALADPYGILVLRALT